METRASFVLIGTFTLAVIAAAFGFVLWFQSLHTTKARSPLRVIFEGPATGLRNGGSVNFNGIRVGEVISVKLDNPRRVVALAMVENNAPLRKDTQVGLEFQGLTGVAAISLKGGDIVVRGSVGHMGAFMAQRGRLVVCGDAGEALGDSLYEARIYVRGEVAGLGADCVAKEMRAEHVEHLVRLLAAAEVDADAAEFRRYGSARQLYTFKVDNVGAY